MVDTAQTSQQAADQIAQQAAQQTGEVVRQVLDATRTAGSQEVGAEREFETGTDERYKFIAATQSEMFALNTKRTYDEYQNESLANVRENRQLVNRAAQLSIDHDAQMRQLSVQALQNAVETANMVGKQVVRHGDLAVDRQWNVDEVSDLTAKSGVQSDLATTIALAVVAALKAEGIAK